MSKINNLDYNYRNRALSQDFGGEGARFWVTAPKGGSGV